MSRHFGVSNPAVLQVSQSLNLIRPTSGGQNAVAGDPYFSSVPLLLKADGANNATGFVNSGSTPLVVTRIGNTKISTTQSEYGGSSAYFDGNGDYLSISNQVLKLSNIYTAEFWVYLDSYPTTAHGSGLIFNGTTTSDVNRVQLAVNSDGSMTANGFGNSTTAVWQFRTGEGVIPLGTWVHVALCSDGTTVRLFADGVLAASGAGTEISTLPTTFYIGFHRSGGSQRYLAGYIDDFRLTQGVARYTENFTTPDAHPVVDLYFSNVSVLLKADGEVDSTAFVDSGPNGLAISASGNTKMVAAPPWGSGTNSYSLPYGGTGAYFDGDTDHLSIANDDSLNFGNEDFTIEMWVNTPTNWSRDLFAKRSSVNEYGILAYINYSQTAGISPYNIRLYIPNSTGTLWAIDHTTAGFNGWAHVAFVRNGNEWASYVNGVKKIMNANLNLTIPSNTSDFTIGVRSTAGHINYSTGLWGVLDDFRITKGVARYTANFTPPGPHPTSGG